MRDACRAMSNVKRFNRQLATDRAKGERQGEEFAELRFRSRFEPAPVLLHPRRRCYRARRLSHYFRTVADG